MQRSFAYNNQESRLQEMTQGLHTRDPLSNKLVVTSVTDDFATQHTTGIEYTTTGGF
jgi:hypothetical protein